MGSWCYPGATVEPGNRVPRRWVARDRLLKGSMSDGLKEHVVGRLKVTTSLAVHLLIDAAFLALCAVVGWVLDRWVFDPLAVQGMDAYFLLGMRIMTDIALFLAVARALAEDIIIAFKQMIARIKK